MAMDWVASRERGGLVLVRRGSFEEGGWRVAGGDVEMGGLFGG